MTDQQAAEAREKAERVKAQLDLGVHPGHFNYYPAEEVLALCDTVDALSARLAQAEQDRDEAQKRGDHLARSRHESQARKRSVEARLREYEEALRPFASLGDDFTPERHPGHIEEVWRFPWSWIWCARAVLAAGERNG